MIWGRGMVSMVPRNPVVVPISPQEIGLKGFSLKPKNPASPPPVPWLVLKYALGYPPGFPSGLSPGFSPDFPSEFLLRFPLGVPQDFPAGFTQGFTKGFPPRILPGFSQGVPQDSLRFPLSFFSPGF